MVQVLDRIPSFGENLANQFIKGMSGGLEKGMSFAEKINEKNKLQPKEAEKLRGLHSAVDTVNSIEKILNENPEDIGPSLLHPWASLGLARQGAKNRQELATLSQNLLPYISSINPRNQKEFDQLLKGITDPTKTVSENLGALKGIKRIISSQMGSYGHHSPFGEEEPEMQRKSTNRKTLDEIFR